MTVLPSSPRTLLASSPRTRGSILTFIFTCLLATTAFAAPETYTIDNAHSGSNFEIEHLGLTMVPGRFDKTTGKITLDRAAKVGSIEAEIDTSSINTGWAARDKLLKSDDYFNVEKFPTITFRASKFRFKDDTPVAVDGELTMLGVTRPVTLELASFKCIVHPTNKREICGTVARTSIKRSDFGMTRASRSLGEEVRIWLNLEAIKI